MRHFLLLTSVLVPSRKKQSKIALLINLSLPVVNTGWKDILSPMLNSELFLIYLSDLFSSHNQLLSSLLFLLLVPIEILSTGLNFTKASSLTPWSGPPQFWAVCMYVFEATSLFLPFCSNEEHFTQILPLHISITFWAYKVLFLPLWDIFMWFKIPQSRWKNQ